MAEKEYIEREALIDFCKKIIHERWNETTAPVSWSHAYADFIDDINNQPAANVVPVKYGHWISAKAPITMYKCSECEALVSGNDFNFCPNCGAEMNGGDKNAR